MRNEPHPDRSRLMPDPVRLLGIARATAIVTSRIVTERALNAAFRDSLSQGGLDALQGRCLYIRVTDIGLGLGIGCSGRRLLIDRSNRSQDVVLEGQLQDFLLLATRRVDPDTLFFQRRLKISGDTALGLVCKNAMDAVDIDAWPRALQQLLALLGEVVDESSRHRVHRAAPDYDGAVLPPQSRLL